MKKYFYLSWFVSGKKINQSLKELASSGLVDSFLKEQWLLFEIEIEKERLSLLKTPIGSLCFLDSEYPEHLRDLDFPPWVLTYYGNLELLKSSHLISLVGSRRPDPEAEYWIRESVKKLSPDSVLISGGAIGIDQSVHKAALLNNLCTVVVLPVGLKRIYPKSIGPILKAYSKDRKDQILVLSQFAPDKPIFKSSFYPRNYVLASLSSKLVVVQAEKKSGTMVTAQYAIEMGKEVYTLPAAPWDSRYSGNLKLLEDGAYQLMDLSLIH